jgi:TonB family protein
MLGTVVFSLFLSWVQVSSDTFIVKSSAGEERAKKVLQELEGFHQLIGSTLVFRNTKLPEIPIEVLLVGDEETLKELQPEYNGRKLSLAGYYQMGPDRDFIVLSGRVFPETLTSVVYHELTHYFLTRGLESRPQWLNEGLAEYFSTAEIHNDEISLGAVSLDRLQLLKTSPVLPLRDFFAVDSSSPYYNESSKASVYYAEAWAFMYYMMHGEHAERFKGYLAALQKGDASLLQYLNVSERDLETGFQAYLKVLSQRSGRTTVKVSSESWDSYTESIPETEAQMSIAEIFLANGKLPLARRHLELLSAQAPDSTRVSYYRGILAQLDRDPAAARDFFVDALTDPFLAPRAAVRLVDLGDKNIPSVRTILEQAGAMGTRNPEVYLALTKIYTEDLERIEEAVRLQRKQDSTSIADRRLPEPAVEPLVKWSSYMRGGFHNFEYDVMSGSDLRPRVAHVVTPYYPMDLLDQKLSGEVVVDVQVTEEGKVGGIWQVSASPDVFANLATAAVRQWEFEPIASKIRIVVRFKP